MSAKLIKLAFIDSLLGYAFLADSVIMRIVTILAAGFEGVPLFFLVSALTLFLSLESQKSTEARPLINFYILRSIRIVPMFYLAALFYYWYDTIKTGGDGPGGSSLACIVATLTFTNGWVAAWTNRLVPGGWSIAVEMNFYLLVPFLYRYIRSAGTAATTAFVLFLLAGLESAFIKFVIGPSLGKADAGFSPYYWLSFQISMFLLGIFLFFLIRPTLKGLPNQMPQPNPTLLLGIAFYLMIATSFSNATLLLGPGLFGVAFVLLGWSLALRPTPWLVNPFVCYIDKVSFSAYLSHFFILDIIKIAINRQPPILLIASNPYYSFVDHICSNLGGATILVSALTYHIVEIPGQKIGHFIINQLENKWPQNTNQSVQENKLVIVQSVASRGLDILGEP